ncbi:MAG TPA: Mu-like prophage major head subunit gpT family protein [Tepidisphaeraceae bacterium]|nr:Mu-like prophage major head subunit gpT family protein [Tepidisphaeraceae bacterium]
MANIYTGLNSLSTIIPGMESVPNLAAFSGTRQKNVPTDFEITLTSAPYESSVEYPLDNYNLDSIGIFENNVRELARKARYQFNKLVTAVLTTNGICSDGQNFFDTDHPYTLSGAQTQKNLVTASDISTLAVANKLTPTDVEMANVILDLFAHLIGLKDRQGDEANGEDCRSVTLLVGDMKKWTAAIKAVSNERLSNLSDNPLQGLADGGVKVKPIFVPTLTGDSIYMLRNDGAVKAVIAGEVVAEPIALGPESEYAREHRKVLFAYDAVRGACPGRYQSAVKATLSNAA